MARELLRRGHKVRALTRDPSKQKARDLANLGAEIVQGDFDKPDTIERAGRGTAGAFLMGTPFEKGPEAETRQATAAIDAAVRANVPYIAYSSVCDADLDTGIPHFDSKARVEEHLRGLQAPHAIVAPAFFRENLLSNWMLPSIQQGRLSMALAGDRVLQNVELDEIAQVTAEVLEHPALYSGKRINLASDETTPERMAQVIHEVTGHPVEHNRVGIEDLQKQDEDSAKMFRWFQDHGYTADIQGLRRQFPNVRWHGFSDWAGDQEWGIGGRKPTQRPPPERKSEARTPQAEARQA